MLYGIFPCNYNLKKWKIITLDTCDNCSSQQTIKHLLFECTYARKLWSKVKDIYQFQLTFSILLGQDPQCRYNSLLTLLSFLIYKEWLLKSLDRKLRNQELQLSFYKYEVDLRLKIYKNCNTMRDHDMALMQQFVEEVQ